MQSLPSVRSEHRFRSLLAAIKCCRPVSITESAIRKLAIANPVINARYRKALSYLRAESISATYSDNCLVDRVLGLDAVVNYKGWVIGIDVTLDPSAVQQKSEKLDSLAIAHRELGIDLTMVVVVNRNLDATVLQSLIREAIASRCA